MLSPPCRGGEKDEEGGKGEKDEEGVRGKVVIGG